MSSIIILTSLVDDDVIGLDGAVKSICGEVRWHSCELEMWETRKKLFLTKIVDFRDDFEKVFLKWNGYGNRLECKRFGVQSSVPAQCSTYSCEIGSIMINFFF